MSLAGFGPRRPFGVRRVRCQGAGRPGCGTGGESLKRGRALLSWRRKGMPPNKEPPGPRSHANQRALKAPGQRRPSLAEPRRGRLCHNTPQAPSFFAKEQHQRVLYTLTTACSRQGKPEARGLGTLRKLADVTSWVRATAQVPPDERRASQSGANPTCSASNGGAERGGAR